MPAGSVSSPPATEAPPHAPSTVDGVARPMCLLVVDDEPDVELLMQQRFRRRIRKGEVVLLFAGDGIEALEQLAAHPEVDIVLADINMPRMDGLTLLDRIREQQRLLKVVIVSAYGDLSNIRTAMNRGAFDFVTKPISFDDLDATIAKTYEELTLLRRAVDAQQRLSGLERELEIAREIQHSALPGTFPAFPERDDFDLFATMQPAREVGGDFYDFFLIDAHHLGVVLGDVSGKGVGAALFMAMTRTLLRATALQGMSPDECLRHVNLVLWPESPKRLFVTVAYGVLDLRTGRFAYCLAGHQPPIHVRADDPPAELPRTRGVGLCLVRDFAYASGEVTLRPGEQLVLFSDGVVEAVAPSGERFEDARLLDVVAAPHLETPRELVDGVVRAVSRFAEATPQHDDITVLAVQYSGPERA